MRMQRWITLLLAGLLAGSAASASMAEEAAETVDETESRDLVSEEDRYGFQMPEKIESRMVDFYAIDSDGYQPEACEVMFFDGRESIAYMSVEDMNAILLSVQESADPGYNLEGEYVLDGDICLSYSLERENGASVWFDFTDDTFCHDDVDRFSIASTAVSGGDIAMSYPVPVDEDGLPLSFDDGLPYINVLARVDTHYNFERSGYQLSVPLVKHHLTFYYYDDKLYLPVTTYSDFIMSGTGYVLSYMGSNLFLTGQTGPDNSFVNEDGETLYDIYRGSVTSKERPQDLAEFNYWELTTLLDMYYGLKEEHRIENGFDEYFEAIGLKDSLMSTDSEVYAEAMAMLTTGYFADLHSAINGNSPYVDDYFQSSGYNLSATLYDITRIMRLFREARDNTDLSDWIPDVDDSGFDNGHSEILKPYEEVGNTAYLTFDKFDVNPNCDIYEANEDGTLEDYIGSDTFALVAYSQSMINRDDSPIENVVIDLTNNGGGAVDTALYLIAWVLGECDFSSTNPISDTQYTVGYLADTNLDHRHTSEDNLDLTKHRVYCLTSMNSFSCGNLVPCVLKASNLVTILGQTSGGGACVVKDGVTADGTLIQYSGPNKICIVRNGSYYGVDRGVDPDVAITDPKYLYDRIWLTTYINSLPC